MLLTNTWVQVGLATSLVVSPATPEDWTVLKLNRRKVEREVLEQVEALPCILPNPNAHWCEFYWTRFR